MRRVPDAIGEWRIVSSVVELPPRAHDLRFIGDIESEAEGFEDVVRPQGKLLPVLAWRTEQRADDRDRVGPCDIGNVRSLWCSAPSRHSRLLTTLSHSGPELMPWTARLIPGGIWNRVSRRTARTSSYESTSGPCGPSAIGASRCTD